MSFSTLTRRTPLRPKKPMARGTKTLARTAMKKRTRRKQIAGHHDKSFLDACRDEPCYLKVRGVCLGESGRDTVVPCHSNDLRHGGGAGLKAKDTYTVPGCHSCHAWLDQGKADGELRKAAWEDAYAKWLPDRQRKIGK